VVFWATTLHNLFFVLFILVFVGHIGAILLKPNRPMIRGIFTGRVRLDYAKHRHPLWLAEIEPSARPPEKRPEAAEAPTTGYTAEASPGAEAIATAMITEEGKVKDVAAPAKEPGNEGKNP
jgi:hypothetical protein